MVPCVPITIMLYTKATINSLMEKYLNTNINRNGARQHTINQLMNESQFFLFLNTFKREKNSLKIWPGLGLESSPNSFFQPYEGGSNTLSKKAIAQKFKFIVYNFNLGQRMKGMYNIMKLRINLRALAHTVYKLPDFILIRNILSNINSTTWHYCLNYRIHLVSVYLSNV